MIHKEVAKYPGERKRHFRQGKRGKKAFCSLVHLINYTWGFAAEESLDPNDSLGFSFPHIHTYAHAVGGVITFKKNYPIERKKRRKTIQLERIQFLFTLKSPINLSLPLLEKKKKRSMIFGKSDFLPWDFFFLFVFVELKAEDFLRKPFNVKSFVGGIFFHVGWK